MAMKPTAVLALILLTGGLAACGGSSNPGLPRTSANVAACKVLRQVLAGQASAEQLVAAVLETNAPITRRLRQDLAQYATTVATVGVTAAQQMAAQASQDCTAIGG